MALLTFGLLTLMALAHAQLPQCKPNANCNLPNCFCPTFTHPTIPSKDIPQLVYFGFDDAVNVVVNEIYQQLFNNQRKNPNGCAITMSLYIQNQYTDYDLVHDNYLRGNEIASHSVQHTFTKTYQDLWTEASVQKSNLQNKGGVPENKIVGWRSPYLASAGNDQPKVLKKLNYMYDISLAYTRRKMADPLAWPFTLDYGFPYSCSVPDCPSPDVSHPGFWEIPINLMFYRNLPCPYVDSCRPDNLTDAVDFLKSNFDLNYKSNRAPFGLNMHAAWFLFPNYQEAMSTFLDYILAKGDVYVVSASAVLDWMRNPITIAEARQSDLGCPPSISNPTATLTSPLASASTSQVVNPGNASSPETSIAENVTSSTTVVTLPTPQSAGTCLQGVNCRLPDCQCRSFLPPGGLAPRDTPQIVYLTFIEGAYGYPAIKELLTNIRNPNGCPIRATFFVPLGGINQNSLQSMRNDGHEIALYGSPIDASAPDVKEQLTAELSAFRIFNSSVGLTARAGTFGQGYRSPVVNTLGNSLFPVLNDSYVIYDSSLVTSRTTSLRSGPWPYTLDFGWQEGCSSGAQCPSELDSYPSLWEMPITPLVDYLGQFLCTYADACFNRPSTEEDTFQMFMKNFNAVLNTNRAPMGIHLRREWFSHSVYLPNRQGLVKFLNYVTSRVDVYVMSVEKMLDWLKNPTPLDRIGSLESWKC